MAPTLRLMPLCLLAARVVCAAGLFYGADAGAIGLKQAYEAALQNDPTYRAAYFDNESGKENLNIGRAGLLPSVSASYSTSKNRTDDELLDKNGKVTDLTHPEYTSKSAVLQLRQSIINLDGLARYREGVAQTQLSAAQFSVQGRELVLRVTGAYIDALFAEEQLALVRAQRDTLVEQRRVNDRSFAKGEGTRTDMIETQARLDLAEAQVIEATDNVTSARNALSAVVGAEVTAVDTLAPDFRIQTLPEGGVERWKALARTNNPELLAQGYAIDIARQEIARNRAGHMPRLDFTAAYSKNDAETVNTNNQNTVVRSIGVQLSVPIYSGGYVSATTRQAVAGHEKAKADLQFKSEKVMVDLRKQYDTALSSVARIEALDKAVASNKLLVKATEQSIKGGVRINLDLLNAQQQLFTSQRDLAQARYNYLLSLVRLRAAAGVLGPDDVADIASYFR